MVLDFFLFGEGAGWGGEAGSKVLSFHHKEVEIEKEICRHLNEKQGILLMRSNDTDQWEALGEVAV